MAVKVKEAECVYLGVGSNLGDRFAYLERAKELIQQVPHTRFVRSSSVIETDPVGGPPQGKFLNAVWELETMLPPEELRERLLQIEERVGRKRTFKNAPREIDLDILFYGNQICKQENLEIPHPRLHERAFVLKPLSEIAPNRMHPQLKKTIRELSEKLEKEHCLENHS